MKTFLFYLLLLPSILSAQVVGSLNGRAAINGVGTIGGAVVSLSLITETPTNASLTIGQTQAFVAIGTYSDGTQQDVTGSAVWTSSNLLIAALSSAPSTFQCIGAGTATVKAQIGTVFDTSQLTCAGLIPPVHITTLSIPDGQVLVAYTASVAATGGVPPYVATVQSGAFPAGVSMDSLGNISGTPALGSDGPYSVTVKVTDSGGILFDTHMYNFTIAPPVTPPPPKFIAELPRAYLNVDGCPGSVVIKKVCTSGDPQCPGGPGDYLANSAGLNQCIADGAVDGREWQCRATAGATFSNVLLPVRPASMGSCVTIASSNPITPFNYILGEWGQEFMRSYFEDITTPTGRSATADRPKRWIAQSTGNSINQAAIRTDVPSGGNVAHHYQILDAEITPAPGVTQTFVLVEMGRNDSSQPTTAQLPHDIILRRWYAHGDAADTQDIQHAIQMQGVNLAALDGICDGIHFTGSDSQCISGNNGTGIYTIINNYLRAASENIIWGGSFSQIPDEVNCDLWIAGNYFSKDILWYQNGRVWNIKNLYEDKTDCRVLFEKNRLKIVWADGQAGGALLTSVRFANNNQTIHDNTYRYLILSQAAQLWNGIDGGSDGSGNGQSPSLGMDYITAYQILAYDIGSNRFTKVGQTTVNAQAIPVLAQNQKFGADSATITSQSKVGATGVVTVTLSAAPPQVVVGLPVILTGTTNGFNGTFTVASIITPTQFTYIAPVGIDSSSTGGSVNFACSSTSDAAGNVTTSCPDTNCGLRSPCAGGFELNPGDWVSTTGCAVPGFNAAQAPSSPTTNPHSLTVTYPWLGAPPSSSTTCQLVNHSGSPRHLNLQHIAVIMRDGPGSMLQSSPQQGNAPLQRDLIAKNMYFTSENAGMLGMFTGGHSEGTSSEAFAWAISAMELHHIGFQGRLSSRFTEFLTAGSTGVTPPTTIWGPTSRPCAGVPDANCMGWAGNYAYPDPDAGGKITAASANGSVITTTVKQHDLTTGMSVQISAQFTVGVNLVLVNGTFTVTALTKDTFTFPNTISSSAVFVSGTVTTGHDYHDWLFCTGPGAPVASCSGRSFFAAGGTQSGDDGTMLGPDITAIDLAMKDCSHPAPSTGTGSGH